MSRIAMLSVLAIVFSVSHEAARPERCSYTDIGPWLSIPERVERAEYLFTGYALDHLPERNGVTESDTAVFIVENSWKGPHPDTLHVFIGHVCPQLVRRGATYIVAANEDAGVLSATRREGLLIDLGGGEHDRAALDTLQQLLGAPGWKAPPMRERGFVRTHPGTSDVLGRFVISIGEPLRGGEGMSVSLIGDSVMDAPRSNGFFVFTDVVLDRIYILRVKLPDGERQEEYFVRPVCQRAEFGCMDVLQIRVGAKADPLPALADSAVILPGLKQAVATVVERSTTARSARHLTVDIASIISVTRILGGGEATLAAASGAALAIRPDAVDSEIMTPENCIAKDICPDADEVIMSLDGATFTGGSMMVDVGISAPREYKFASPVATWKVYLTLTPRGWVVSGAAMS